MLDIDDDDFEDFAAERKPRRGRKRKRPVIDGAEQSGVFLNDFFAYRPMHNYICAPTGDAWPAASVNAALSPIVVGADAIQPSAWLDAHKGVEQMSWCPGEPALIKDKLMADGGWIERRNWSVLNLYRPPTLKPQAGDVTPWLDLVRAVFPDEIDHIMLWLAHRVQKPQEKINHALVLGGKPGIGKDTIVEPVKATIGPWNFADVSPQHVLGRFNGFLKSVILRVSEARDLSEFDRFAFHDHMKTITAAPPDVLRVDQKHINQYYIPNLCGVVITTNKKTDGIYLPADDRRHYVAWSTLEQNDFELGYWRRIYAWYANGGDAAVAHYLASLDLSQFDPKAPPPKTSAFWEIASANRAPEDAELADMLDSLGRPDVVTVDRVASESSVLRPAFAEWLRDRKNARRVPHRFEDCGYVAVRNPHDAEGRWKIDGKRYAIYGRDDLALRDRIAAAYKFARAR